MSKRVLQVLGAMLLVVTVGIVSCQGLFAGTSGLGAGPKSNVPAHLR
jgi:hypothetical protein